MKVNTIEEYELDSDNPLMHWDEKKRIISFMLNGIYNTTIEVNFIPDETLDKLIDIFKKAKLR